MSLTVAGATLIGAGIGAASGALNHFFNARNQRKQAERTNQINRENWKMENAYNSPTAQMARLRAAGLNPHLIYQNGAPTASGSIESPQLGSADVADYSGVAEGALGGYRAYLDDQRVQNQASQIASVIELNETMKAFNEANKGLVEANKYGKDIENAKGDYDLQYYDKVKYQEAQQAVFATKIAERTFQKLQKEMDAIDANTDVLKSTLKLNDKQVDMISAQIRKIDNELVNMFYVTGLKQIEVSADVSMKNKQIEQLNETIQSMQQSRNINKWLEDRMSSLDSDLHSSNPLRRFSAQLVQAFYNLHDILPMSGSVTH